MEAALDQFYQTLPTGRGVRSSKEGACTFKPTFGRKRAGSCKGVVGDVCGLWCDCCEV